jgi:hypothetical protein
MLEKQVRLLAGILPDSRIYTMKSSGKRYSSGHRMRNETLTIVGKTTRLASHHAVGLALPTDY